MDPRIVLASLWIALMFCYSYGDYFELYVPHKVEGLLQQHNLLDSPFKLFTATLLLALPALMIPLGLIINKKSSGRLNLIFGIFYTLINLMTACTSLTVWMLFYVFLAILETGLTLTISYKGWLLTRSNS